ncbi:hypothetical protein B5S31_g3201 [[Candida] boidinii]|nr:hypothetical protein B5S31_g3201 [[Candida] boidinii]
MATRYITEQNLSSCGLERKHCVKCSISYDPLCQSQSTYSYKDKLLRLLDSVIEDALNGAKMKYINTALNIPVYRVKITESRLNKADTEKLQTWEAIHRNDNVIVRSNLINSDNENNNFKPPEDDLEYYYICFYVKNTLADINLAENGTFSDVTEECENCRKKNFRICLIDGQGAHYKGDHSQQQSNKPQGKQSNKPQGKQSNKPMGKRLRHQKKKKGLTIPKRGRSNITMNEIIDKCIVDESALDSSLYSDNVVDPYNVQARNQEAPMHSNTTSKSESIVDQNKTSDEAQKKRGLILDNKSPQEDLSFSKLKQKQKSRVQKRNIEGHEASYMTRGSVGDPEVERYQNRASHKEIQSNYDQMGNVLKNENNKDTAKHSSKRESRRNKNKNKISKK